MKRSRHVLLEGEFFEFNSTPMGCDDPPPSDALQDSSADALRHALVADLFRALHLRMDQDRRESCTVAVLITMRCEIKFGEPTCEECRDVKVSSTTG